MNKELLETQWVEAREFLRNKWSKLTEEDIRQINGRYDLLVDKLEQRYGYTREQAEEEVRRWNIERTAKPAYSTDKSYTRQEANTREEERSFRKDDSSSFFKWLLAIAIPVLLLAWYFGTARSPEVTSPPRATTEENTTFTENPADQSLSRNRYVKLYPPTATSFRI